MTDPWLLFAFGLWTLISAVVGWAMGQASSDGGDADE